MSPPLKPFNAAIIGLRASLRELHTTRAYARNGCDHMEIAAMITATIDRLQQLNAVLIVDVGLEALADAGIMPAVVDRDEADREQLRRQYDAALERLEGRGA